MQKHDPLDPTRLYCFTHDAYDDNDDGVCWIADRNDVNPCSFDSDEIVLPPHLQDLTVVADPTDRMILEIDAARIGWEQVRQDAHR